MLAEPILAGVERTLKVLVLSDGFEVHPAGEDELAHRMASYIRFVIKRLAKGDRPIERTLWNLLDAPRLGHKLAEITYDVICDGPWAGKVGVRSLRCKPRQNYTFVVDEFNGFRGVCAKIPGGSQLVWTGAMGDAASVPNVVSPEKILLFCLDDEDGDPRGRSWFRGCYDPWYRKQSLKPEEVRTGVQFGGGSIDVIAPEEKSGVPVTNPFTGQTDSLLNVMNAVATRRRNGGVATWPYGTTVQVNQPSADPRFFDSAFSRQDREMVTSFLLSARTVLEAEFGSKADAANAQDLLDELKKYVQRRLCQEIQAQLFYRLVELSFGREAADSSTPVAVMQKTRSSDFSHNASGVAALMKSGYLDPSQYPGIDSGLLGIPSRDSEKEV